MPPWRVMRRPDGALTRAAKALLAPDLDRRAPNSPGSWCSHFRLGGSPAGKQGLPQRGAMRREAEYEVVGLDSTRTSSP